MVEVTKLEVAETKIGKQKHRRWPAEWEKHAATWMAFPCRHEIWKHGLEQAQLAFARVANLISKYEPVKMLLRSNHLAFAKKKLSSSIELIEYELDDSWMRDIAPLWVFEDQQSIALDFKFNAWGNKFSRFEADNRVARNVATYANTLVESVDMILEGGSIHGNGKGVLMTTKECLLNTNRNPSMTMQQLESELAARLGIEQFIWLEHGLVGDVDTDGHIDNIACFVDSQTIVTQTASSPSENKPIYDLNRKTLNQLDFDIIELPEPNARYVSGQRVPLSYINFYIANDCVLVPQFGSVEDDIALHTFKDIFGDRKVHTIDANEILVGGGGIHCITMQQPLIDSA